MLALFSLRLAFGMLACLPLLPARLVAPRFYRTHLLTALGLCCLAMAFAYDRASGVLLGWLVTAIFLSFFGSVVWQLEGAPGGRAVILAALGAVGVCVLLVELDVLERICPPLPPALTDSYPARSLAPLLVGDFTSAALLGTAVSAMLMGHSHLIAPGMSLAPLMRLLAAFVVATLARMAADGFAIGHWYTKHAFSGLSNDTLLWLPTRWAIGFVLPLALCWMAWQSARMRSTQSATGILYVVVVFCFLGELTGLLLRDTGLTT